MTFNELNIIDPILSALKAEGYATPTPIQVESIPVLLSGRDLLGSAQTGTGKTAAFAVPILQDLYKNKNDNKGTRTIKALILAPTRELAAQIGDSFVAYGSNLGLKTAVIFGGVSQNPQTSQLRSGVDILVATPGRLLDLINQRFVNLNHVKYFVLDEADRMLDMGFVIDVNKIITKIPAKRQTMLFSATMPQEIIKLSKTILTNPVRIAVTPVETTVEAIKQAVYFVSKKNKISLLEEILKDKSITSALVFSRTKHGANKIVKMLDQARVKAEAIHGNKSQTARQRALHNFKTKQIRVLVATDIAARGIDIDELSHVFNYDLPEVPETYIHRIGRTGRAGLGGMAISFCSEEEADLLKDIEKHISTKIPVIKNHPYEIHINEFSIKIPLPKKPTNYSKQNKGYNQKSNRPKKSRYDSNYKR